MCRSQVVPGAQKVCCHNAKKMRRNKHKYNTPQTENLAKALNVICIKYGAITK
jgi:hypothetical protein